MKFEIGKIYEIEYKKDTFVIQSKDSIKVQLQLGEITSLISDIVQNEQKIKDEYSRRKIEWKPYFELLEELNKMRKNRKKRSRKTDEEKRLEEDIKRMRDVLQAKKDLYKTSFTNLGMNSYGDSMNRTYCRNMFIRILNPEKIKILKKDVFENRPGLFVVYAGKSLTNTGKTVEMFYTLSPIRINKNDVNENIKKFIVFK